MRERQSKDGQRRKGNGVGAPRRSSFLQARSSSLTTTCRPPTGGRALGSGLPHRASNLCLRSSAAPPPAPLAAGGSHQPAGHTCHGARPHGGKGGLLLAGGEGPGPRPDVLLLHPAQRIDVHLALVRQGAAVRLTPRLAHQHPAHASTTAPPKAKRGCEAAGRARIQNTRGAQNPTPPRRGAGVFSVSFLLFLLTGLARGREGQGEITQAR